MENVFLKIIKKEIPANIVFENENVIAFHDINPQAPIHIVIIPKKELISLSFAGNNDLELLGELLLVVKQIAARNNLIEGGYRVVINNGDNAGQTVPHLHLHLLGGRAFLWPPG